MKRSEAREKVFKIIFQMEFQDDFSEIYLRLLEEEGLKGAQYEYAENCIKGIIANKDSIDSEIERFLKKGWKLERLPNTVKSLLRLSVFEILFTDIPNAASINEAVSLAKIYCDDKDAPFINGILRNIDKEVTEDESLRS